MSTFYQTILEDLSEPSSVDSIIEPPPFKETTPISTKIKLTFRKLHRAKRMDDRISILVNAFYIGQIIEEEMTPAQRTSNKSNLTAYYYQVCVRTYYIFEKFGLQQIYRTRQTTLAMISKLKSAEYRELSKLGDLLDVSIYETLDTQII
jgi:hypothetical protein